MSQTRRRGRSGPPLLVLASVVAAISFPAAMTSAPIAPPACLPMSAVDIARAVAAPPPARASVVSEARLDSRGGLTGYRLAVSSNGGRVVELTLPPESFVAPLTGRLQLVTVHAPGSGSLIRAIDVESGCAAELHATDVAVRSALLHPAGTAVYLHAVTAAERRDLGISRLDLASGGITVVIEPLTPDERYGITFATMLGWSLDGNALAVQSCGFALCRTRVLDLATGDLTTYAGEGHGALVGLDERNLYVFDHCHGRPCPLLAVDLESGAVSTIHEEAFDAHLANHRGTSRLLIESTAGTEEVTP